MTTALSPFERTSGRRRFFANALAGGARGRRRIFANALLAVVIGVAGVVGVVSAIAVGGVIGFAAVIEVARAIGVGGRRRFFVIAVLATFAGCTGKSVPMGGMPPVPVLAAKVVQRDVPNQLHEIGTVEAFESIAIKVRVGGNLQTVNFKEGDFVKKGQLLLVIDPRPFAATLAQAQANLARDQANANQARINEQRFAFLFKEEVGSRQQHDDASATAASLEATVAADRAAVESAKLNLQYTEIRSPVDGRTGKLQAHPGDLIKADADTAIVTIHQVEPIYVDFSIPEKDLAQVRRNMEQHPLEVDAAIPGDPQQAEHGVLSFVDNTVDKTTGMIALKGLFQNENRHLWPGQFVNTTLTLAMIPNAVLVPSPAIQTGQEGAFVYVVGRDMKVEARPVVPGAVIETETIVERGLKAGETVVTDGQLRLMPGAVVRLKTELGNGGDGHGANP
ncbi:MAG: rane fusion protein multidrug efflux system [Candidatus Binataceae bacterium]|jgi:membrane fusion protein, multidrug efflux system|nr:rane fusion protein multidrug efflux system [Candidatus Binataceae bacterium]MEA2678630.1 rane fusion protein multidrug efflux system [Candidatus Binataceae bacterium]